MIGVLSVLGVLSSLANGQCPNSLPPVEHDGLDFPDVGPAFARRTQDLQDQTVQLGNDEPPKNVSCAMRKLAVDFSEYILGSTAASGAIAQALNVTDDCSGYIGTEKDKYMQGNGYATFAPGGRRIVDGSFLLRSEAPADGLRSAVSKYIDASKGNDNNDGSYDHPWATIARAVEWLKATPPSQRSDGANIMLAPGTYVQTEPLSIPEQAGGSSASSPVVFQGTGTSPSEVVITGALPAGDLAWQPMPDGTSGGYCASLPAAVLEAIKATKEPVRALHLNQSRYWPARWPNADPNKYCSPFNQPPGGCPGLFNADKSRSSHGDSSQATAVPATVALINDRTGATMATGPWSSSHSSHRDGLRPINVSAPSPVWDEPKETCTGNTGWTGPSVARFLPDPPTFWRTSVPSYFHYCAEGSQDCPSRAGQWSNVQDVQVHMYHPSGWGGWVYRIAEGGLDVSSQLVNFSSGGYQEARGGGIGSNAYYFANVREELDDAGEFYVDGSKGELCVVVPQGTSINAAEVSIPLAKELVVVQADNVRIQGVSFTGTAPVYLSGQYVVPSGGDYSIDKRGAVHIDGATNVQVSGSVFHLLEGTGLMVTGGTRSSGVSNSQFSSLGENGVGIVGTCEGLDCTKGTHPVGFKVEQCLISDWGVWGKQTSAVFQSVARASVIDRVVAFGGPRNGINFNDGLGGGTVLTRTLGFNSVLETSDNGWLNTWDRQPYAFTADPGASGNGVGAGSALTCVPDFYQVSRNFVFRGNYQDFGISNNIYNLDNDDGSSRFQHSNNVLVGGAIKFRDGKDKHSQGNLVVYPDYSQPYAQAFQVNGFKSDSFTNNTLVSATGQPYGFCAALKTKNATATGPLTANNTFVTPMDPSLPFSNGGCGGTDVTSLKAWQAFGFDKGTRQTDYFSIDWLVAQARARLWAEE